MDDIRTIALRHRRDPARLLDMVRDIQAARGCVPPEAAAELGRQVGLSAAEVLGVVTFYHFFTPAPAGRNAVYLNSSITSWMAGRAAVARAFEEAAGCRFGETTADGLIGLHATSCVGMNDQEPAAVVNGLVFTRLTPEKARALVAAMKAGRDVRGLLPAAGPGADQAALVRAMVADNIRRRGPVLFGPHETGSAVRKAAAGKPEEVIAEIKAANLLGRGGAGFPTGLKWEFCRREKSDRRFVVCNADEGEPGTFKDRVLLTEAPGLVFEGMAVAGWAAGAREGILYLRAEYAYLRERLEGVLEDLRRANILGKGVAGNAAFDFDIEITSGAGAYVCGEESALLNSAEGKRGEPRDRPPFPVQKGYLDLPTTVNNVETLATAARILAQGAPWFKAMGTTASAGTKLLSVSGDCERPGVYEVEFGLTVGDLLKLAGAPDAAAVQVGGPSGTMIGPAGFGRKICFSDLATGGSVIVFGPERDLVEIVRNFMAFFIEESCGWCVPCRAGNPLLLRKFEKIAAGRASARDLVEIEAWGKLVKSLSRCGLGQTSPNPILTTLQNFRPVYEARLRPEAAFVPEFDLAEALKEGCEAAGRTPACRESLHD